jgi:hypothetical protein
LLDTRSGELSFHCGDWRHPPIHGISSRSAWDAHFPGTLFVPNGGPQQWADPMPELICWVIDSGVVECPYLDAAKAAAFLQHGAPLAQQLLDHLLPIPGTDERDYSPESASAGRDIERACSRRIDPPLGLRPNLMSMDRVVEVMPELVNPRWAEMNDDELAEAARTLTTLIVRRQGAAAGAVA